MPDYRTLQSLIVHTVHIGAFVTGENCVVVALHNDGLTVRSPGLTPERADQLANLLTEAADQARIQARQQAAAAQQQALDKAA